MRYWMLTVVLLAFWLGRETGAGEDAPEKLVLEHAGLKTVIRPGRIEVSGPGGRVDIYASGKVKDPYASVTVSGPVSAMGVGPATCELLAHEHWAWSRIEGLVVPRGLKDRGATHRAVRVTAKAVAGIDGGEFRVGSNTGYANMEYDYKRRQPYAALYWGGKRYPLLHLK